MDDDLIKKFLDSRKDDIVTCDYDECIKHIKRGSEYWNEWRRNNPRIQPGFRRADLREVDLSGADLSFARFLGVDFEGADLSMADLSHASLIGANLWSANLSGATLHQANLARSNLWDTNLSNAELLYADLQSSELHRTNCTRANLTGAKLMYCQLVNTDFTNAILSDCRIFGISSWEVELEGATQKNLIITPGSGGPTVAVDNLEVAQFVYLLLTSKKIRNVINTIGQKAVMILGRFKDERKKTLDSIADALRQKGFVPIIFDFDKPSARDFTETIKILAGLSLFVIADITNPKSNPLELQATVPDYMIPFVPIIQEGEEPFSMFVDLQRKYAWVLPILAYDTTENLLATLDDAIIKPALEKHKELVVKKAGDVQMLNVRDYLPKGP